MKNNFERSVWDCTLYSLTLHWHQMRMASICGDMVLSPPLCEGRVIPSSRATPAWVAIPPRLELLQEKKLMKFSLLQMFWDWYITTWDRWQLGSNSCKILDEWFLLKIVTNRSFLVNFFIDPSQSTLGTVIFLSWYYGLRQGDGFLTSSMRPAMFFKNKLCMFFSSMLRSLRLQPCTEVILAVLLASSAESAKH